ncbi:MAG: NUDIX hydrolase [Nitrospira sp. SB0672_bin_25]|nr:NUDIX hydrolase [Nitrospira sp. SB0666_bin_27]MYF24240.1 NUDIX hydrolase [Nitrospira sp. SB0678_bin_10]MYJ54173.1 NUDIX hydrolase [Nitrospira sp. SB0672_bin_25]
MKKPIYKGKIIDLSVETVTLPNGATADLEVITHPGAAAVVPMKDDRMVVMVRQYRHAVGGFIYEIPAGKLHPGEDPGECAAREVEEETGYKVGRLEPLLSFLTTPGFTNEIIHIFVGHELSPGTQNLGADEVLEIIEMPLDQAIARINDGGIQDAKTIIGLQAVCLGLKDR